MAADTLIDLTGQRFGRLTVISRAENRHKKVFWNCDCDCGNKTVAKANELRNGRRKSCGCLRGGFIDIAGKKFGKLTVVERARRGRWLCDCDCGNQTVKDSASLRSETSTHCGCLRKEKEKSICSFSGCERPATGKQDLCITHYSQQKAGKELKPIGYKPTPQERIEALTSKPEGENGCWRWHGHFSDYGRPRISRNGKPYVVARLVLEARAGPVPDGKPYACHDCGNGWCVNPNHLRWDTAIENARDQSRENYDEHGNKKPCSFPGCNRPMRTKQLCKAHYQQLREGRKLTAIRKPNPAARCAFGGCDNPVYSSGLCSGHYQQRWHGRELAPLKKYRLPSPRKRKKRKAMPCAFPDCNREAKTKGLCVVHYSQHQRGKELKPIGWKPPPVPLSERIKAKTIESNSCWFWAGFHAENGRPMLSHEGKNRLVARLMLKLTVGYPPPGKPNACHSCGNKRCVNPTHLRWDSQRKNIQERYEQERKESRSDRGVFYDRLL